MSGPLTYSSETETRSAQRRVPAVVSDINAAAAAFCKACPNSLRRPADSSVASNLSTVAHAPYHPLARHQMHAALRLRSVGWCV